MQQQDNEFPIDQIQSGGSAGSTNPPVQPAGGASSQPQPQSQANGQVSVPQSPTPDWQQTVNSDAMALYQQPESADALVSQSDNSTLQSSAGAQAVGNMQQDFAQANNLAVPSAGVGTGSSTVSSEPGAIIQPAVQPQSSPQSLYDQSVPSTTPVDPSLSAPMIAEHPIGAVGATDTTVPMPLMTPAEPIPSVNADIVSTPSMTSGNGLPGASQLGVAANGMDQSLPQANLDPNLAGVDPMIANMDGMGTYGPPPNNKKKLIFIIGGAVLGLLVIIIIIMVIVNSSARKPAQNLSPTTEPTSAPTPKPTSPPASTPAPSSGPATPPQGYVTIEKQCYSFALYDPNTVPADKTCSFKNATFGKLKTSTISVLTTTDSFKNLDEYINSIKPTLTVTAEESIKLDNMDAKQIIYKASDGKTYSRILALIVGKNYQQDGKPVTGIDINITYQEDFDKKVTKNVLDTWRWK